MPDGTLCLERLTGAGLTDDQAAIVNMTLADPQAMPALDAGAVRSDLQANYDSSPKRQALADRATFEDAVDSGYAAVASKDVASGRVDLQDADLGSAPGSAVNSWFLDSEMLVVLNAITANGLDALANLTPETGCVVSK